MSFGFSIGDFIAAGELAERLYKEIYLVARHASQELLQLQSEVATLSMSINLLVAEVQDKDTVLARSGKDRVDTVNSVLKDTKKTILRNFRKASIQRTENLGLLERSSQPGTRQSLQRNYQKLMLFELDSSIKTGQSICFSSRLESKFILTTISVHYLNRGSEC